MDKFKDFKMSITISDKAIILTKHNNLFPLIMNILSKNNICYYSDNSNFSSINSLKKKLNEEKNLSFLKKIF